MKWDKLLLSNSYFSYLYDDTPKKYKVKQYLAKVIAVKIEWNMNLSWLHLICRIKKLSWNIEYLMIMHMNINGAIRIVSDEDWTVIYLIFYYLL